ARRGKDPFQFPSAVARRSAQRVRNGRLFGSKTSSKDAMSLAARLRRGFRVERLPDHCDDLAEALAADQRTPIPDQVCFRCDFPHWLQTLSARNRELATELAKGHCTSFLAKRFGLSDGRISQLRRALCESWHRFIGESLPTEAQSQPIAPAQD